MFSKEFSDKFSKQQDIISEKNLSKLINDEVSHYAQMDFEGNTISGVMHIDSAFSYNDDLSEHRDPVLIENFFECAKEYLKNYSKFDIVTFSFCKRGNCFTKDIQNLIKLYLYEYPKIVVYNDFFFLVTIFVF